MKSLNLKTFLVLVLFSLVFFAADKQKILNPIKSVSSAIIMPFQYGFYSIKLGIGESFSFLTFWRSGEARIKNLELRNLELISYEQQSKALAKENEILRKQMGVSQTAIHSTVPATVLFSGNYLLIAVGEKDTIKVGQSVVIFDNFLGKISKVNPRTAVVRLPSDPQSKTPVKIGLSSGLVSGQFNSSMSLDRIAVNEEIAVNDIVLTSGEGDLEPNLIVGKVGDVQKIESDLFQKITVVPVVNFHELTTVFVIIN